MEDEQHPELDDILNNLMKQLDENQKSTGLFATEIERLRDIKNQMKYTFSHSAGAAKASVRPVVEHVEKSFASLNDTIKDSLVDVYIAKDSALNALKSASYSKGSFSIDLVSKALQKVSGFFQRIANSYKGMEAKYRDEASKLHDIIERTPESNSVRSPVNVVLRISSVFEKVCLNNAEEKAHYGSQYSRLAEGISKVSRSLDEKSRQMSHKGEKYQKAKERADAANETRELKLRGQSLFVLCKR